MSLMEFEHEGQIHRLVVVRQGRGVWVAWPGGTAFVEPTSKVGAGKAHEGDVVAPLTGKVITVEAAVGDEVAAHQVVAVIEAMKMEYRLTAPKSATVKAVHCRPGALVDQGKVLIELS